MCEQGFKYAAHVSVEKTGVYISTFMSVDFALD